MIVPSLLSKRAFYSVCNGTEPGWPPDLYLKAREESYNQRKELSGNNAGELTHISSMNDFAVSAIPSLIRSSKGGSGLALVSTEAALGAASPENWSGMITR